MSFSYDTSIALRPFPPQPNGEQTFTLASPETTRSQPEFVWAYPESSGIRSPISFSVDTTLSIPEDVEVPGLHSPDLSRPNITREDEMIFDSAASMANMVNMEALSQSLASMSTIRTYAEAAAEAATAVNVDKENQNPTQE